ncbi:Cysteine-rich membrane protein 1 [Spironucleus salmonicida]|uniref:Cysteine-rich membrane protein 1 n=1 Tax=Spironucleus salmonicida TaxID=348837 RepID=A0A9P8LP62_9EUKA|nr:Cysteine-rich membrane protein 1 [Spironucleus salmonicida]
MSPDIHYWVPIYGLLCHHELLAAMHYTLCSVWRNTTDCNQADGYYCNEDTHQCKHRGEFCGGCLSQDFCYKCISKEDVLNSNGTCTTGCKDLEEGFYCNEGKQEPCFEGIASACRCKSGDNCATCSIYGNCHACLPNYQINEYGNCFQCALGYEIKAQTCVPTQYSQAEAGTCSLSVQGCRAGFFCPAVDKFFVKCQKCNENMTLEQSCYCVDYIPTANCIQCAGLSCGQYHIAQHDHTTPLHKCHHGCFECDENRTCLRCAQTYVYDENSNTCNNYCQNNKDCEITLGSFCDTGSKRCTACQAGCLKCSASDFCEKCDPSNYVTTTAGLCTPKCDYLLGSFYCNNGAPAGCEEGITSQCKCGDSQNCATCTQTGKCASCFSRFALSGKGDCQLCQRGYAHIGDLCVAVRVDPEVSGSCTSEQPTCKAGYFCPAVGSQRVQCQLCHEDMALGESCYCADHVPSKNCVECVNGQCTRSQYDHKEHVPSHPKCLSGCYECDEQQKCLMCAQTFILDQAANTCSNKCETNQDCAKVIASFCDTDTKRCTECPAGCSFCSSATFCDKCEDRNYVLTTTGLCTSKCENIPLGFYCNDGLPEPCHENITSQCNCGNSQNCALCNSNHKGCLKCLPNMQKNTYGMCLTALEWKLQNQKADGEVKQELTRDTLGISTYLGAAAAIGILTFSVGAVAYIAVKKARKAAGVAATAIN